MEFLLLQFRVVSKGVPPLHQKCPQQSLPYGGREQYHPNSLVCFFENAPSILIKSLFRNFSTRVSCCNDCRHQIPVIIVSTVNESSLFMINIFEPSQYLLTENRIISLKLGFSWGMLIKCVGFVAKIPS